MAECVYLSRFDVLANTWSITGTCDGDTSGPLYIPAGSYYLDSATAAESLVAAIDALLESLFPAHNFTVTYSTTTGKITCTCTDLGVATWTITFGGGLENAIGFGAAPLGWAPTAATAVTSPEVCQYCIFAESARQNWSGYSEDVPNADGKSTAGVTAGVSADPTTPLLSGSWTHGFEPLAAVASPLASGTRDDAGTVRPWTWQDFFRHHKGRQPFRFYDGTGLAIGSYEKALVLRDKSLKGFGPENQEKAVWEYWIVNLEVDQWRAAS